MASDICDYYMKCRDNEEVNVMLVMMAVFNLIAIYLNKFVKSIIPRGIQGFI